jgi:2-polyprenyl-6-methoxyphenol hydroxylase-like FAD-dependent oxidoreductase
MIMTRSDVLIVGAGPTGLALALWLTKLGANMRIIDKTAGPATTSRALAVHARTLELYRQLGLADIVVARGHKVPAVRLWLRGEPKARVSFEEVGAGLTRYPFLQIFPQDEHERLLIATLEGLGVSVERNTELLGYSDEGGRVIAQLRRPDGGEEHCEAAYIAGCDGVHSIVRETMGTGYPGVPTVISFMSRMSRRPARQSMVHCMSTLKRLISLPYFRSPGRDEPG